MEKLNVGCGLRPLDGYVNLDIQNFDRVDVVHDILHFPWPFDDNTFDEVRSSHVLQHITFPSPGDRDPVVLIFEEVHRILKPDGVFHFITSHIAIREQWTTPLDYRAWGPNSFEGFYIDAKRVREERIQAYERYYTDKQFRLIRRQMNRGYPLYQWKRRRGITISSTHSEMYKGSGTGDFFRQIDRFLHRLGFGKMEEVELWLGAVK